MKNVRFCNEYFGQPTKQFSIINSKPKTKILVPAIEYKGAVLHRPRVQKKQLAANKPRR